MIFTVYYKEQKLTDAINRLSGIKIIEVFIRGELSNLI
jgi:hypothetical protein